MNTDKKHIIILTDGRSGHETQSYGISTILNKDQNLDIKTIKIKHISKLKKSFLKLGLYHFPKEWMLAQLFDLNQFEGLDVENIQYIVSAGGDTLLPNAVLKSYLFSIGIDVKNIIATSLRGMPESAFDVIFTIDASKSGQKPYAYYPIAPNKLLSFDLPQDEKLSRKKLNLTEKIGVWSVLIGADSHDVSIGSVEEWIMMLEGLANSFVSDEFYVSTSRRTSKAFEQSLKNVLKQYRNIHLILVGEGDRTPIADLMYAANIILCSPDSTSMVSESLILQKPLFIVRFPDTRLNQEFEQYYEAKINRGWLQFYTPNNFNISTVNDFKYEDHALKLADVLYANLKS